MRNASALVVSIERLERQYERLRAAAERVVLAHHDGADYAAFSSAVGELAGELQEAGTETWMP